MTVELELTDDQASWLWQHLGGLTVQAAAADAAAAVAMIGSVREAIRAAVTVDPDSNGRHTPDMDDDDDLVIT